MELLCNSQEARKLYQKLNVYIYGENDNACNPISLGPTVHWVIISVRKYPSIARTEQNYEWNETVSSERQDGTSCQVIVADCFSSRLNNPTRQQPVKIWRWRSMFPVNDLIVSNKSPQGSNTDRHEGICTMMAAHCSTFSIQLIISSKFRVSLRRIVSFILRSSIIGRTARRHGLRAPTEQMDVVLLSWAPTRTRTSGRTGDEIMRGLHKPYSITPGSNGFQSRGLFILLRAALFIGQVV